MGMNVQKVSFGNTPVAGTTPGAAQQAPVKKADKGDVVVIGGKEFTKKQVAIGGAGILAGAAVLATGIVSYMRGKTAGIEGFTAKIKEGFHTLVNKEARAEYAEKFGKKAQKAAEGAKDKAADAVAEGAKDKAGAAAADNGAAAKNATDAAANKGATAQEGAAKVEEKATTEAPKPTADLEQARKEAVNKEIQARADLQKAKNSGTPEEIAAAEAKLKEARNEAALAKHNLKEAQKANGQARIEAQKEAQLQKTIQTAKDELASAEKELADLNKVKAELEEKGKNITTNNQRKKHNKAVRRNNNDLAAAEGKVEQAKANLIAADPKRTELADLETKLTKQKGLKDKAIKAGKTDLAKTIQKGIDKLNTDIEALKAQIQ